MMFILDNFILLAYFSASNEPSRRACTDIKASQKLFFRLHWGSNTKEKAKEWRSACIRKMLRQIIGRFQTMAQSGKFWEEALPDMYALAEMVRSAIEDGTLKKTDLTEREWGDAMRLLESPRSLYDAWEEPIHDKIHAVRSMLDMIGNRRVIIFGCGNGEGLSMCC